MDPAQKAVVNHPLVMYELESYLDAKINGETQTTTPYHSNTRGIPALLLLEKSLEVMIVSKYFV